MGKKTEPKLDKRLADALAMLDTRYKTFSENEYRRMNDELLTVMNNPPAVKDPAEYEARMKEHAEAVKAKKAELEEAKEKGYTEFAVKTYFNEEELLNTLGSIDGKVPETVKLVWHGMRDALRAEGKALQEQDAGKAEVRSRMAAYLAAAQRFILGAVEAAETEGTTEEQLLRIKRQNGELNAQKLAKENYNLYAFAKGKYGTFRKAKAYIDKLDAELSEREAGTAVAAPVIKEEVGLPTTPSQSYASVEASDWEEEDEEPEPPKPDKPVKPTAPPKPERPPFKLENGERKVLYELNRRGSISKAKLQKETGTSEVHMENADKKFKDYGLLIERGICDEPADTWTITPAGRRAAIADVMEGYNPEGAYSGKGEEWVGPVEDFLFKNWQRLDKKETNQVKVRRADVSKDQGFVRDGVLIPPRDRLEKLEEAGFIELEYDGYNFVIIKRRIKELR